MHLSKEQVMDTRALWQAVQDRDASLDGLFVFAVETTGVFCKPSCAARRPKRENVRFFNSHVEAERQGFRPCLRCRPTSTDTNDSRRELAESASRLIDSENNDSEGERLSLSVLAERLKVSPFKLHRAFKQVYGVTPRQYAESRRLLRFKKNVRSGNNITDALYEAGYGSSSRLYEKSSTQLGMTPASYRRGGQGTQIRYSIISCQLGLLLTAATERGLCAVHFGDSESELLTELKKEFPLAELLHDETFLLRWSSTVNEFLQGRRSKGNLPLDIQASAFQWKVWNHLRTLPQGATQTYSEVANAIGRPTASRAVAKACATNPLAIVIPCHRVVPVAGGTGGYRWGAERKQKLLELEASNLRKTQPKNSR